MTIDKIADQETNTPEKQPVTVQNEIQKEVLKETISGDNSQKQLLQLLAGFQPQQQIEQTARTQISKGFLDIKI